MRFILLIALLFPFTTIAQTREELTTQLTNLFQNGEMQKAMPVAQKLIDITRKESGENSADHARSLTDLAAIHFELQEYNKAELLIQQAATIRKNLFGENHPEYAGSMQDMAMTASGMGNFEKALTHYQQAAMIWRRLKGELSMEYATTLENISGMHRELNDLSNAESSSIAAAAVWQIIAGPESEQMAANLYSRALTYYAAAHYVRVEELLLETARIRKGLGQGKSSDYASCLSLLGMSYTCLGKYDKAEPVFLEALNLEHSLGNENNYATALSNLGTYYQNIGQFKKAEPLFLQVLDIKKRTTGDQHSEYATALDALSVVYAETEAYEKAESASKDALAIRKKILSASDPEIASTMHNLAAIYFLAGKNAEAEKMFLQVVALRKKILGEAHPDYATSITALAAVYYEQKKYKEAEPLLLAAAENRKRILGSKHPDYAESLNNLALLYNDVGESGKAEPLMIKSNTIMKESIANTFSLLSEKEKAEYLENRIWILDNNSSMLYKNRSAGAVFVKHCYEQLLFFKSLLLSDSRNMLKMVQQSKDTALKKRFEQWSNYRKRLSEEYALPLNERSKDLARIEDEANQYEKILMSHSASFRKQQADLHCSTDDIRRALAPGEAAIEFVSYDLFDKKWTDSVMYAAYILRKEDSIPVFVPLCEETQLQQFFDAAGNYAPRMAGLFYQSQEGSKMKAGAVGKNLYQTIWAPLEPYLKGIERISYAPAGKLFKIAFHALPVDSAALLMDKYELRQYISTKDIVLQDRADSSEYDIGVDLFGNPDFTMDSLQLVQLRKGDKELNEASQLTASLLRSDRGGMWPSLPGTAAELKTIDSLFSQNKITSRSHTGVNASEAALKELNGRSPKLLHIATHGFFLRPVESSPKAKGMGAGNTYTFAKDPLLRSGLILSGGNYAWSGKTPIAGVEDGIVTAYEVSQMDLTQTSLVVLSACETALGDVKGSEGVFGLQRAFKMAGVGKMIVSLWKVPDQETAALMSLFYNYLLKGMPVDKAFRSAQNDMRKNYSAFYWAAFTLIQ